MMLSAKNRKLIAVFLLIVILNSVITPSVSYALTAGPTAPEATSFEPVDTTDMVDIKTGDFTYNVPLLEVPGPAGGYPLSLSYHAGIQPDQEASWTGLGYTLNPGSISRLVNGYPDDHNNVTNIDRSFWEGGETETYTVGVSVGIANVATVSAGMSFAQDTYRGRGVGGYVGLGIGYKISNTVGIGVNTTIGISPYGDSYSSTGIQLGVSAGSQDGMNLSANIGLSVNSNSGLNVGAGAGVGVGSASLLDVSISSNSSSPSLAVGGGVAGVYNSKSGNVSTHSEGFQVDIPVYYGVNVRLGRDYQRYWIDETQGVHTFGSLYFGDVNSNFLSAFDTYDLLDTDLDIAEHDDAEKVLGGSFPEVDFYTVTAQGVGGNIRPYHYQQNLYRQDKRDVSNKVLSKSYPLSETSNSKSVEFRFINDFSNRFEYDPGDFNVASDKVTFDFEGNIVTGKEGNDGFNNNHLAGSKHIEWYTNQEILRATSVDPFQEGFVDCVAEGFERRNDLQIGGFSITNSSGVTYHYALPAYSFEEYMKSENSETKQEENGLAYNELRKPERYAYTWFLTGVTGPDFVDRNGNGLADHGDWGYWVNFEYKKWLGDYKWRNPGEGTNRDLDGEFQFFSAGKKEIYYLDKIITESHVAVFEKSVRNDGREVIDLRQGGFRPTPIISQECLSNCQGQCEDQFCDGRGDCQEPGFSQCSQACYESCSDQITDYIIPRAQQKLDRIKLYNYNDYVSTGADDNHVIRAIGFEYDYSLAQGTPNSYEQEGFAPLGKLTLKSLDFLGKKNVSLIPPITFDYKNLPYAKDKVDVWGFYKNDFDPAFRDRTNDIIGKLTTEASAGDVDAWSLTSVTTSLGAKIKINYESDRYEDVALARQQVLRTKSVTDFAQDKLLLTFWEEGIDLSHYFEVGQSIDVDLIGSYNKEQNNGKQCNCDPGLPPSYQPKLFSGNAVIDQIDNQAGSIVISNADYYNWIKNETKEIDFIMGGNIYPCEQAIITCKITYSGTNAWPDFFPAGVVSVPEKPRFGGGIRVKSLGIDNPTGDSRLTLYEYANGTTSYEPFEILAPKIIPEYLEIVRPTGTKLFYKKSILNKLYKQIGISRQVPGPGVMYQSVTIREKNITPDGQEHTLPNYSRYEFETFKEGMVDVVSGPVQEEEVSGSYDNVNFNKAYLSKVSLKDYSARVGNLKSITLYNAENNQPVSSTVNHYLHDDLDGSFQDNTTRYETSLAEKFKNQGVIEQTFSRARIMLFERLERIPYPSEPSNLYFPNEQRNLMGVIGKLETFPSVPTGQTNVNYKTGIKTTSQNVAFDFYSGEATEVRASDSYGNTYLSVSVPAYHQYEGMGLKIDNSLNRHMLSQVSERYTYLLNSENAKQGLLSASIQTWSDNIPVLNSDGVNHAWRKHASYQWNGQLELNTNGSYPYSDFAANPFDYASPEANGKWEKTGELTLYDVFSHALEAKDINGNFASTRMNKDNQKVIASATNAAYNEIAFSGSEFYAGNTEKEGGVDRGEGNPSSAHIHTGKYSLLVGYGSKGFNYTLTAGNADLTRKYRASVWVYAPGEAESQDGLNKIELFYTINGQEKAAVHPTLQKNKSKSWYLLNLTISPESPGDIYIGVRNQTQRGVYFDDFRVHPLDAVLTSYVYDPFTNELSFMLDARNFYTKFEYDAMGRIIRTSKELLNFDFGDGKESFRADAILKEVKYNYGNND